MTYMYSIACVLLLSLGHLLLVSGKGVVKIKFIKYENTNGLGANGQCCDGKWGFCQQNGCDHMFTLCLDAPGRANDVGRCQYGRLQSTAIKDSDINVFGAKIANLTNPIQFTIDGALPVEFDFKVVVYDHDKGFSFSGGNDHVDTLTQRMVTQPEQNYITKHRTRLVFKATMECSLNFYGKTCAKYCGAPSLSDHYKCDLSTGQKVCLPGWTGSDCKTKEKKPCDSSPCLNGGSCVERGAEATCKCTSQFNGARCEQSAATQAAPPRRGPCGTTLTCQHGGLCIETSDTEAKCVCVGDFTGSKCETAVKPPLLPAFRPAGKNDAEAEIDEFFATPEPSAPPMEAGDNDCDTLAKNGFLYRDGIYKIKPSGSSQVLDVFCDMTTEGWTVIQRRKKGNLNFNKDWESYKNGFGEIGASEDFWLGLDKIYMITKQDPARYKLRIKMKAYDGEWITAEYSKFWIDDEAHDYRLHVSGYSGTAGDGLNSMSNAGRLLHNGQRFSTPDKDRDNSRSNCARKYQSGWWFNDCAEANLNGPILEVNPMRKPSCGDMGCMSWNALTKYKGTPFVASVMMIKPN